MMRGGGTFGMWLAAFALAVMLGFYGLLLALPDGVICECPDPAAQCQEDEVWAWVADDTRGCVHYEEICDE